MSKIKEVLHNLFFIPDEELERRKREAGHEPMPLLVFKARPRLLLLLIVNYFIFWFNTNV